MGPCFSGRRLNSPVERCRFPLRRSRSWAWLNSSCRLGPPLSDWPPVSQSHSPLAAMSLGTTCRSAELTNDDGSSSGHGPWRGECRIAVLCAYVVVEKMCSVKVVFPLRFALEGASMPPASTRLFSAASPIAPTSLADICFGKVRLDSGPTCCSVTTSNWRGLFSTRRLAVEDCAETDTKDAGSYSG